MDGLFLGFTGGAVTSIATVIGSLLIFFKNNFNKDTFHNLRLDFFLGLLLTITSVSLLYPTAIEKNINLGIAAFFLGVLFLILSKIILKSILESIAIDNSKEQKAILFILVIILKNIPVGLAAGASMYLKNGGVGNSLLIALTVHNLFDGIAIALCFLSIGFDPFITILGSVIGGVLAITAGLFGGYLGQEDLNVLSLIMAFSGGALMSAIIEEALGIVKKEFRKIISSPSFVSVMVVMLIFIVWKELL